MTQNARAAIKRAHAMMEESGPIAAMNFLSGAANNVLKDSGALKDTNLSADFEDRVKDYKNRFESDGINGIMTGLSPIDKIFGGLQGGDFVLLIGYTGMSKTWHALLIAINAWLQGYRPLIISLEMNKFQMGYRVDTIINGGVDFTNDKLIGGRELDPGDYLDWAKDTFEGKQPFYLVTQEGIDTATQNTVQAKIEQYKPDLVVLDYHGLFEDADGSGNETDKTKNLSKAFKRLAVKYNVPILDVAAVTPKGDQATGGMTRPPELHEIAWSRQLAYDADLVLAIHRAEGQQVSQIVARKSRRSPLFGFYLEWDLNTGKWSEKYDSPIEEF